MAGKNDIQMKITADSSGVARGMAPMMKSLDSAQKAALETEQALDSIGTNTATININDQAVENARAEIARLRDMMREQLRADVNADTTAAQRRIRELQRTIKVLDDQKPVVEVGVEADTTRLAGLREMFRDITAEVSGGGGLAGGLGAASRGISALGATSAGAAGGVGALAIAMGKLGLMAADVETSVSQLDALTKGLGAETFADLQKWAAATPFAIDDATEATKKLVAAGVPLQDIPDWLNDIGNVASATGVPIEQVGTVFSQMVSKGKASYEELQQLAEAGVPVWQVLADKLGLTVAQVQKMATEGKLGADAIDLLRESLNQLYPDAMKKQADTFNGQMSTFKDTLSQVGQTLGTTVLPLMTDFLQAANALLYPVMKLAAGIEWLDKKARDLTDSGLQELALNIPTLGLYSLGKYAYNSAKGMQGVKESTDEAGESLDDLVEKTISGMEDSADAAEMFKKQIEAAEDAIRATTEAFRGIGAGVRAKVDFIISRGDLQEEIDAALKKGVELPARLNLRNVGRLTEGQEDLVSSISEFVTTGLEEGARRAEIVPGFDEAAWYRTIREQTSGLLIDAGIDPKNVERTLTGIFGLPQTVPIDADISGAKQDLKALEDPLSVMMSVSPYITGNFTGEPTLRDLLGADQAIPAPIAPTVPKDAAASATATLDSVAQPGGSNRKSRIDVLIDPITLSSANYVLDQLLKTETKIIKVHMEENPTGEDLSRPGAVSRMIEGTTGAAASAAGGRGGTHTTLAPRQTPVKVYLDSAEIADHLVLKAGRLATTTTVKRRA